MTWRNYHPDSGRWLSQEPNGFDGPNLYSYVHNKSQKYTDRNGLWAIQIGIGAGFQWFFAGSSGGWGTAISYSKSEGIQIAGYQYGAAKGGIGAYAGVGLEIGISPNAKSVCELGGFSKGDGFETFAGGASISDTAGGSLLINIGPGTFGSTYGAGSYTNIGTPATIIAP